MMQSCVCCTFTCKMTPYSHLFDSDRFHILITQLIAIMPLYTLIIIKANFCMKFHFPYNNSRFFQISQPIIYEICLLGMSFYSLY